MNKFCMLSEFYLDYQVVLEIVCGKKVLIQSGKNPKLSG